MRRALIAACAALACPGHAWAYGAGDASRLERALHLHTDRVRVDPGAADPAYADLPPALPLVIDGNLHDAARFYAEDMSGNGCFPADHASCDGTPYATRVDSFYTGRPIGENIARGQPDAETAVYSSWLHSDGHRANMLDPGFDELGTGFAAEGGPFWVQDFGREGHDGALLTSGTHEPTEPASGATIRFTTAWRDTASRGPAEVLLVVDTECAPMEPERGADGGQTFTATRAAPDAEECLPYWFLAEDASGGAVAFPSTGSLLAPIDGATCPSFTPDRRGAECAPQGTGRFGGAGAGCGGSGEGYGPDANVGQDAEYGSCRLGGGTGRRGAIALLALLLRRRRRPGPRPRHGGMPAFAPNTASIEPPHPTVLRSRRSPRTSPRTPPRSPPAPRPSGSASPSPRSSQR